VPYGKSSTYCIGYQLGLYYANFQYDLQTGAVTVDGARLVDDRPLATRPVSGWRPPGRQVVSTAMFTAPLTVREELQTA